jgi:anti-sigma regulatory factor (Ser/Thr protein kinase)
MQSHPWPHHSQAGGLATARFSPEPAAPGQARRFVAEILTDWSCESLVEEVNLLTSELVTNAVLHARTPVELTLCRTDGGVRVEVADEDPHSLERALRQRRRREATTGRGLAMVAALARHWGVTLANRGKSVWFEMGTGFGPEGAWVPPERPTGTNPEDIHG